MVNTHTTSTTIATLQEAVLSCFQKFLDQQITTCQLVQFSEIYQWELIEGQYRNDNSEQAGRIKDVLTDIMAQWESRPAQSQLEFPIAWIQHWRAQIQSKSTAEISHQPPNPQPTININTAGTINTGNTTIQGDQVGIQYNLDHPANTIPQTPSDQPKNNFSGATFNGPVNLSNNLNDNVIDTQNNYSTDPEIKATLADLKTLIAQLQTQHPTVTTETAALTIIDAEFTEIKRNPAHKLATLRQQILNPERHLQATKATLSEIAKHYLEESIWAKAGITYLDKLSESPGQAN
jgi:hypothetical protein